MGRQSRRAATWSWEARWPQMHQTLQGSQKKPHLGETMEEGWRAQRRLASWIGGHMKSRMSFPSCPGYGGGVSQGGLGRGHRHRGARSSMPGVGEEHTARERGGSVVVPERGMALALSGARGSSKNGCGAEEAIDRGSDLVKAERGRDGGKVRRERRRVFVVPDDVETGTRLASDAECVGPDDP